MSFIKKCVFHLRPQKCTFEKKAFFWYFAISDALLLFGYYYVLCVGPEDSVRLFSFEKLSATQIKPSN